MIYVLFLFIITISAIEIGLRINGFKPWTEPGASFKTQPKGGFFQPDSLLGFRGRPGLYHCQIGDSLSFSITHDSAGFRSTGSRKTSDPLPEIWIFGCSFTHGYGVDDHEAWPYIVQSRLPEYKVRNFGMTAYGTYQSFLLLKKLLKSGCVPNHVVYAYGTFHEQRNTASRFWRKAVQGQEAALGLKYAFLRDGKHRVEALDYEPWPWQDFSALVHLAETWYNHQEEKRLQSSKTTADLLKAMRTMVEDVGANWTLAVVQGNTPTQMERSNIIGMQADLQNPMYRLSHEDGHPNALGHARMAELFLNQFKP